jgi:hypothetical protein
MAKQIIGSDEVDDNPQANVDALYYASAAYRREYDETEGASARASVPYVPTNWAGTTKAEILEVTGGFDEKYGICPSCFMVLTRSGVRTCFCE